MNFFDLVKTDTASLTKFYGEKNMYQIFEQVFSYINISNFKCNHNVLISFL